MKYFEKRIHRQHIKDLGKKKQNWREIEYYYSAIHDLATSFNREWASSGILDLNDIIQECHLELIKTWANVKWKDVDDAIKPQAYLWTYLKRNILLNVMHRIDDQKDGIRIPHYKRWELNETKDVYDFLTQLFPTSWFWENDEKLNFIDEPPEQWDNVQLRNAIQACMDKYNSKYEKDIICMFYGIGEDKMRYREIAEYLGKTENAVKKASKIGLDKLKNEEVKQYLEDFYTFG